MATKLRSDDDNFHDDNYVTDGDEYDDGDDDVNVDMIMPITTKIAITMIIMTMMKFVMTLYITFQYHRQDENLGQFLQNS